MVFIYYKKYILFSFVFWGIFSCSHNIKLTQIHNSKCFGTKGYSWINGKQLFTKFAVNRHYMHTFLYNGNDLWNKHSNLCALGRNTLLNTAFGAGISTDLGLFGSAWNSHVTTIAWTNDFSKYGKPLRGSRIVYSWPVITSSMLEDIIKLQQYIITQNSKNFPTRYKLPSYFLKKAKILWNTKNIKKEWARKVQGALLHILTVKLRNFNKFKTKSLLKTRISDFYKKFEQANSYEQMNILQKFLTSIKKLALKHHMYFPSEELSQKIKNLIYTKIKGYPKPLPSYQLKILYEKDKKYQNFEIQARLREIDYIISGKTEIIPIPLDWKQKHKLYEKYKQKEKYWKNRLKKIAISQEVMSDINTTMKHYELLLSGNYYFATEHLIESSTGFTHASLLMYLSKFKKHWIFERVLGFYYANPVKKFKYSAIVELLLPDYSIISQQRCYATIDYKVTPPFRFKKGVSDKITWINIYSDFKKKLNSQYELGYGFLYGVINFIVYLPANLKLFTPLKKYKKFRNYSYIDYPDLSSLKNKTIKLIARIKK